jgi:two-component system, sporulation sensor kinase E
MIEELDRANSIITEFLSLARNKVVDLKPTDLNNIIKKTLPLIQAQAMRQEQYIKLELNNLPYLLVDQKEIRQLIINLVKNALESMSAPGVVTIRTYVENDQVILAVQDEGPGIESEYLEKIGTPFFTTKKEGTGLGLAVCYRIANQHKARIKIETGPSGTTFFVIF